ncbi:MAG TPA: FecR domain-containing protein [bacterium]|nr:FecR domain-containing protein [bacterium]
MKKLLVAALALILISGFSGTSAATKAGSQGVITDLSGKVQIQNKKKKSRAAKKASVVAEGERVITGSDSKATLQMFDGSELKLSPGTEFQVTKVERPGGDDKIMHFKLLVGRVFASVKKLASSKSSFEVEAGGVVCGVRGTQFGMDYDPVKNKVGLGVFEGSVYTHYHGHSQIYGAGQNVNFHDGEPDHPGNGGNGNGGANGKGSGNGGGNNGGALNDLSHQFTGGLTGNGDKALNDPAVEGVRHLSVIVNVGAGETVP